MNILIKKSFANFLTILNLILGFISIILISLSMTGFNYINLACQMIFFAALIDVFDGKIARKLGTSGNFGKEIDSLADLVSFCVAPSYLIFSDIKIESLFFIWNRLCNLWKHGCFTNKRRLTYVWKFDTHRFQFPCSRELL